VRLSRSRDPSVRPNRLLAGTLRGLRRWWFLRRADQAYARLRADPEAWAEELEERRLLESTLMDGLEDDPRPQEDIERWMGQATERG
jgi:hypothetical protein